MTKENQDKLVNTIAHSIGIIVTILIVFAVKITVIDFKKDYREDQIPKLEQEISDLKEELELQKNYNNWYRCISESITDKECFICDSLYNPNQDFIY